MGVENIMKKIVGLMSSVVAVILLIGFVAYADSHMEHHSYSIYDLTCYINCTASYGQGFTSGVADPDYNYVSVQTFDINQKTISSSYKTAMSKVTLTLTKGRVYGTQTRHAAVNSKGEYLDGYANILTMYRGR